MRLVFSENAVRQFKEKSEKDIEKNMSKKSEENRNKALLRKEQKKKKEEIRKQASNSDKNLEEQFKIVQTLTSQVKVLEGKADIAREAHYSNLDSKREEHSQLLDQIQSLNDKLSCLEIEIESLENMKLPESRALLVTKQSLQKHKEKLRCFVAESDTIWSKTTHSFKKTRNRRCLKEAVKFLKGK